MNWNDRFTTILWKNRKETISPQNNVCNASDQIFKRDLENINYEVAVLFSFINRACYFSYQNETVKSHHL